MWRVSFCLLALFCLCYLPSQARRRSRNRSNNDLTNKTDTDNHRQERVFSLFNLVRFQNQPCPSTMDVGSFSRNGTCFTSSQCASKGGEAAGNCAAGFGICCVFTARNSGSVIDQNCTYIQNPEYPATHSSTAGVTYTVNRIHSDICFLRLDFEVFSMQALEDTLETATACVDSLTITSGDNGRDAYPVICGENSGHHVYVDLSLGIANLDFAFTGMDTRARWDIKTSQIKCGSVSAPPPDCFQYHVELFGRITTFNFANTMDIHLPNQDYSICIRRATGHCCVEYSVCGDEVNPFSLSSGNNVDFPLEDDNCFDDYIRITGASAMCSQSMEGIIRHDRFCGAFLNTQTLTAAGSLENPVLPVQENVPVCDCVPPFQVDVVTDALPDEATVTNDPGGNTITIERIVPPAARADNTMQSRGVCLDYRQIPCNS